MGKECHIVHIYISCTLRQSWVLYWAWMPLATCLAWMLAGCRDSPGLAFNVKRLHLMLITSCCFPQHSHRDTETG